MKMIFVRLVLAAGLVAGVAGCRNLGYNDQSLNNSLTPNVSQTQVTRTWQPTPGQPGQETPTVTTTQLPPADPSTASPPASVPAH